MKKQHGAAYTAVKYIYDKSPGRSWLRLNGALHGALVSAITAHLSFLPDDFAAICNDMAGGYWMGNSEGSVCGERYYTLSVEMGHTPACISFEQYAERPAALWSERVKTPERLRLGSEFTWNGERLTVTNLRRGELIACHYGPFPSCEEEKVGDISHFAGGYRTIEKLKHLDGGSFRVQYSANTVEYSRKPDKIVRITYDQLSVARRVADEGRRTMLRLIEGAQTKVQLASVAENLKACPRSTYRKFDWEDFSKAISAQALALEAA